jgi:hypothetical protein
MQELTSIAPHKNASASGGKGEVIGLKKCCSCKAAHLCTSSTATKVHWYHMVVGQEEPRHPQGFHTLRPLTSW